jgi:hypothetical protein
MLTVTDGWSHHRRVRTQAPTSTGKSVVDVFSQTRQLVVVLGSFVNIDSGIIVQVSAGEPFEQAAPASVRPHF